MQTNHDREKTFRDSKFLQTLLKHTSSYCTISLYSKSNCLPSCGTAQSWRCVALAFDEAVKNKPPNCAAFSEPGQGSPDGSRDRPRVPAPRPHTAPAAASAAPGAASAVPPGGAPSPAAASAPPARALSRPPSSRESCRPSGREVAVRLRAAAGGLRSGAAVVTPGPHRDPPPPPWAGRWPKSPRSRRR